MYEVCLIKYAKLIVLLMSLIVFADICPEVGSLDSINSSRGLSMLSITRSYRSYTRSYSTEELHPSFFKSNSALILSFIGTSLDYISSLMIIAPLGVLGYNMFAVANLVLFPFDFFRGWLVGSFVPCLKRTFRVYKIYNYFTGRRRMPLFLAGRGKSSHILAVEVFALLTLPALMVLSSIDYFVVGNFLLILNYLSYGKVKNRFYITHGHKNNSILVYFLLSHSIREIFFLNKYGNQVPSIIRQNRK